MKCKHDNRYTHADRAEIYEKVMSNPISTLAAPEQYARIPLKGMPSPTGKVYRGEEDELLTNRTAFVNNEYRTHSQSTENFMIQPGLDFYQFEPEERIKEVADAARKYNDEKILKK